MARMYLTIFESGEKVSAEGLTIDPASLYCAFEQVTDGRKKKGKRYPLPLLLTLLMLGKLAGETSVNGIVDWIKERQALLRRQLNWPKRFPTNSTYSEALAQCDARAYRDGDSRCAAQSARSETASHPLAERAKPATGRRAHACGDGWQNRPWDAQTRERGTAIRSSRFAL